MSDIQTQLHEWRTKNFPNADEDQQFLGLVEEVGELAHARLKGIQGIRGMEVPGHRACAEEDAIGDILVYLAGFCSYKGWDMLQIMEQTAKDVMRRDWVKYPKNGFPPPPPGYDQ